MATRKPVAKGVAKPASKVVVSSTGLGPAGAIIPPPTVNSDITVFGSTRKQLAYDGDDDPNSELSAALLSRVVSKFADDSYDAFAAFRPDANRLSPARSESSERSYSSSVSDSSKKQKVKVVQSRYMQSAEKKARAVSVTSSAQARERDRPVSASRTSSSYRADARAPSADRSRPGSARLSSSTTTASSRSTSVSLSRPQSSASKQPSSSAAYRAAPAQTPRQASVPSLTMPAASPAGSVASTPSRRELLEQFRAQKMEREAPPSSTKKRPTSAMSNVSSVSSSSSSIPTSARKKPAQGLNSYTTSLASSETVDPDRVKAVLQERRKQRQQVLQAQAERSLTATATVTATSTAPLAASSSRGQTGFSAPVSTSTALPGNVDLERELLVVEYLQWKFLNAKLMHVRKAQEEYVRNIFYAVYQVIVQLREQLEFSKWQHLQHDHLHFVRSILTHLTKDLENVEALHGPFHQNYRDLAKGIRATLHRVSLKGGLHANPAELLREINQAESELSQRLNSVKEAQTKVTDVAEGLNQLKSVASDEVQLIQQIRSGLKQFERVESTERSLRIQALQEAGSGGRI